jgi:hypothetical protein
MIGPQFLSPLTSHLTIKLAAAPLYSDVGPIQRMFRGLLSWGYVALFIFFYFDVGVFGLFLHGIGGIYRSNCAGIRGTQMCDNVVFLADILGRSSIVGTNHKPATAMRGQMCVLG